MLGRNQGTAECLLETDSLLTIKALESQEINVLEVGHDTQECMNILQEYPTFSVEFIR